MRLGCFLLVIASAFVSTCGAAPAIDGATVNLGTYRDYSTPDTERFLRDVNNGPKISERDADGEARGFSDLKKLFGFKRKEIDAFSTVTLNKMANNKKFKKKVFKVWDKQRLSVGQLMEKLDLKKYRRYKYKEQLEDYLNKPRSKKMVDYLNKIPGTKKAPEKSRKVTFKDA
ncbi:hypothetical protein PHYBOEH_005556 [Phytophthora boehmeriae]|uniref:RxLR effector protein n=1 Tax=Phytophthora boehmeriae TaxID=109152 RepID=A0A8T1WJF6_9STRA|nr:hypothetical protein PHYBOEH_005556 [Phytophthora boehmeriae]